MATVSDEQIRNYFAALPEGTSDEEIMSVMDQFDVSPNDIGRALDAPPEVTEQFAQRYREAGGIESRQFGTEGVLGRDVVSATQALETEFPGAVSDLQFTQEIDRLGLTPEEFAVALGVPDRAEEFSRRYVEAGGTRSRQFGTEGLLGRDVIAANEALINEFPGAPSDLQFAQEIDRLGLTPEEFATAVGVPERAEEFSRRYGTAKEQLPSYDVPALDLSNIELTGDPEQDREILANAIMSGALSLAQQPYEFYPEERVVPFTEEELTGRERTRELAASGVGTPEVERALEVARDVAGYTPSLLRDVDLTPYQTQYQEGVTDIALRELDRQRQMRQQDIAQQAIQAGAFGGARQGVVESELERTYAQQAGDIATRGAQAGMDYALRGAISDLEAGRAAPGVQLEGASALSQGANQLRDLGYTDAEITTLLGESERGLKQEQQNVDYRTFLEATRLPSHCDWRRRLYASASS